MDVEDELSEAVAIEGMGVDRCEWIGQRIPNFVSQGALGSPESSPEPRFRSNKRTAGGRARSRAHLGSRTQPYQRKTQRETKRTKDDLSNLRLFLKNVLKRKSWNSITRLMMKENTKAEWDGFTLFDYDGINGDNTGTFIRVVDIVKAMVKIVFNNERVVDGGVMYLYLYPDVTMDFMEKAVQPLRVDDITGNRCCFIGERGDEQLIILNNREAPEGFELANTLIKASQLNLFVRGFCVKGLGGSWWKRWITK